VGLTRERQQNAGCRFAEAVGREHILVKKLSKTGHSQDGDDRSTIVLTRRDVVKQREVAVGHRDSSSPMTTSFQVMSTSSRLTGTTYNFRETLKPLWPWILQLTDFPEMNKRLQVQADVSPEYDDRPLKYWIDHGR